MRSPSSDRGLRIGVLTGAVAAVALLACLGLAPLAFEPVVSGAHASKTSAVASSAPHGKHRWTRPNHANGDVPAPATAPPPAADGRPMEMADMPSADGEMTVHGRVVQDDGSPVAGAVVLGSGCHAFGDDGPARTGDDGAFVVHVDGKDGDTCTLSARRRDGALWARSDLVDVAFQAGGDASVSLEVPSARTGGVGIAIDRADGGVAVVGVVPGSPAERAGLAPGDVVTQVDGVDAADLTDDEFIEAMTGPEGSEVRFTVRHGDDAASTEDLTATREYLDRARW